MNMDFGANKTPVEVIIEGAFLELVLVTSILLLMVNGRESHGKNLSLKILIEGIISQIIMMLMLINIVLNVEHH